MTGRTKIRSKPRSVPGAAFIDLTSTSTPRASSAVIPLADSLAVEPSLVGAKAAALSRANSLGLPVLPGFVVGTAATKRILTNPAALGNGLADELEKSWQALSQDGARPLVVRSSSVAEDGTSSSMAGMFTSVTDVQGWSSFLEAVQEVVASSVGVGRSGPDGAAPIGVLVQPHLQAVAGGVLFGIDPVTGKTDRLVVAAVEGGPQQLVSGTVDGARYILSKTGKVIEADVNEGAATLGAARRRALAALAARAGTAFGSPQDIEWAFDANGDLWLLQSRPVTATGTPPDVTGPLLGPGPVAETFPDPLYPLEQDLWVEPLKTGLTEALLLVRAASRRRIRNSDVLTTVGGRIAADLELLGASPKKASWWSRLDPRPPSRRLLAGWSVGRLRAAFPALSAQLIEAVDHDLAALPALIELDDVGLVELLVRSKRTLVALHGHEVLAGMLMPPQASAPTGASVALHKLEEARAEGLSDDEILSKYPVVLALLPPSIGGRGPLPAVSGSLVDATTESHPLAAAREDLRLRARWVQELSALSAAEVGKRAARAGLVPQAEDARLLSLSELETMVRSKSPAEELDRRAASAAGPTLPAAFRLASDGRVVVEKLSTSPQGRGAGGGRGRGEVSSDPANVEQGQVLVVRTLDPNLAPVLPRLAGLVAETGSVLSHLAILARELRVPTVVGVTDATTLFPERSIVVVDGTSGDVHREEKRALQ